MNTVSRTTTLAALLAVLCGAEALVTASSLGDPVRYTLGAILLIGILVGTYHLSRAVKGRDH